MASSLVGKKRFKKRTTPLVYPPVFPSLDGNVHESPTPSNGAESLESEVPADADMPVDGLDTYNNDDDQSLTEAGSSANSANSAKFGQDINDSTLSETREKAATAWDNLAQNFISATISMNCIPVDSVCVKCRNASASVHCKQCGPSAFFCIKCTIEHHSDPSYSGNAFHTPECGLM